MCNTGREDAERCEFFRLEHALPAYFEFPEHAVEGVRQGHELPLLRGRLQVVESSIRNRRHACFHGAQRPNGDPPQSPPDNQNCDADQQQRDNEEPARLLDGLLECLALLLCERFGCDRDFMAISADPLLELMAFRQ